MKTTPSFDLVPPLGERLYLDDKIIVKCVSKCTYLGRVSSTKNRF